MDKQINPVLASHQTSARARTAARASGNRRGEVLTASELAALCEVDLKTIHNWVEQGRLSHFRTPGRHLRFRAADVTSFLTAFGYDVPRALLRASAKTAIVVASPETTERLSRSSAEGMRIRAVAHPYDALILAGLEAPDVVFFDRELVSSQMEVERFLTAIGRVCADAKVVPIKAEPGDSVALGYQELQ